MKNLSVLLIAMFHTPNANGAVVVNNDQTTSFIWPLNKYNTDENIITQLQETIKILQLFSQ